MYIDFVIIFNYANKMATGLFIFVLFFTVGGDPYHKQMAVENPFPRFTYQLFVSVTKTHNNEFKHERKEHEHNPA